MFNSTLNVGVSKRVAYNPEKGFKLHIKQSVSVSYRRATNRQKPKNIREQSRVMQ